MTYLPDVNVWIALAAEQHVHPLIAKSWFATLRTENLAFCRITQLGFLRPLTNRHVMGDEVQSVDGAWGIYWKLRKDSRVHFVREAPVMGEGWNGLRKHRAAGPNSWTDAYLLAFAQTHGFNIVTFDRAFPKAKPVQTIVLTA